ncbi:hypothetical protein [Actinomadura macrotermitis]|uniref:Uncharacterized protein n=1 Tax=Actinomadura macrotermitis TaxID=2585200 RepID=A0A7K0BUC2_9ACTN|nr:hypothetical protein [Actinomadura macrotermitis]MQY04803.1 hypothetical protein [Actinomadura macrotermitis]
MPFRVRHLATATALAYAAAPLTIYGLSFTDMFDDGSPQSAVRALTYPASLAAPPGNMLACALAGLLQATAVLTLLRRRSGTWAEPINAFTHHYRRGPLIFWWAYGYAAVYFTVAFWALFTTAQNSESMAAIWLMPLMGPALLLMALPFSTGGLLILAGPAQAWLLWRLLRGRHTATSPTAPPRPQPQPTGPPAHRPTGQRTAG